MKEVVHPPAADRSVQPRHHVQQEGHAARTPRRSARRYILDTTDAGRSRRSRRRSSTRRINISHGADPTPDGKYLLVTDEQAGAAANGVCNVGGVHVYDISNELVPVKVGFYVLQPDQLAHGHDQQPVLTCTAHVLDYGPTGKTFTNADYAAGVRIIDSSDRARSVGRPSWRTSRPVDADTWSAKHVQEQALPVRQRPGPRLRRLRVGAGQGRVDTRTAGAPPSFRAAVGAAARDVLLQRRQLGPATLVRVRRAHVRGAHLRVPDERPRLRAALRPARGRRATSARPRAPTAPTSSSSTPARSARTPTTGSTATSATSRR